MKDTPSIPGIVGRYIEAANRFDAAGAAACFTPDASVRDERQEHIGLSAIEQWVSQTSHAYHPQVSVTSVQNSADVIRMVANVAGDFSGSPVELDYEIRLQDGKISHLSIQ